MAIRVKRAYDEPSDSDGLRILVGRLWPRGLKKEKARIDLWVKDVAPSTALRRWYGHEPSKWEEFKKRYFAELDGQPDAVRELQQRCRRKSCTFLFSSKEAEKNNAVALKEYFQIRGNGF